MIRVPTTSKRRWFAEAGGASRNHDGKNSPAPAETAEVGDSNDSSGGVGDLPSGTAMTADGPVPFAGNILDSPDIVWMDDHWTKEEVGYSSLLSVGLAAAQTEGGRGGSRGRERSPQQHTVMRTNHVIFGKKQKCPLFSSISCQYSEAWESSCLEFGTTGRQRPRVCQSITFMPIFLCRLRIFFSGGSRSFIAVCCTFRCNKNICRNI